MKWSLWIVAVASLSAVFAAPQHNDISYPDATKGEINGEIAVMTWPAAGVHDGKVDALLPAEGCDSHLINLDNADEELLYPCGKWFQPAAGHYRLWLELNDLVSHQNILVFSPGPFEGRGMAGVYPMERGGRVALDEAVQLPANASFRLINIDNYHGPGWVGRLFQRRATPQTARSGLVMPAGRVIATVFDRATSQATSLSRPVQLAPGKSVKVAPQVSKTGADVLAILERMTIRSKPDVDPVEVTLGGKKPDVYVDSAEVVIAIWYDHPPGKAQLVVDSKTLMFPPRDLALGAHQVVTVRGALGRRPDVHAMIHVPEKSFETMTLEARRRGQTESLAHVEVTSRMTEAVLAHLPPEPLEIVLASEPWEFREHVDLSRGLDETVTFDLHPIRVSGTVYYGREPSPKAEVRFQASNGWIKETADSEGRYQATFWQPDDAYFSEVAIPGRSGPPFLEGFIPVNGDRTLDFHVPNTHYVVKVTDALTNKPVPAARIAALNVWQHPSGERQNVKQIATTSDDGSAELAPLRPGELSLYVRAQGYREASLPKRVVAEQTPEATIEAQLQPIGETIALNLRLPDGSRATGAEAWAVVSTDGHNLPVWRGEADANGVLSVPKTVRGRILLIRHAAAGSMVRPWNGDDDATWDLPKSSRLSLDVTRDARLALWFGERRVSGVALSFLSFSTEAATHEGLWASDSLPAQPLRVLAWRPGNEAQVLAGAFDTQAALISYPWATPVAVRTAN